MEESWFHAFFAIFSFSSFVLSMTCLKVSIILRFCDVPDEQ